MSFFSKVFRVSEKPTKDLGTAQAGFFDSSIGEGGSEVVSHFDGKLYVTNGEADRIDIFNIETNGLETSLDLTTIPGYGGLNSVDVSAAGIAVAIENDDEDANGFIALFALGAQAGDAPAQVFEAGNLPDMVTFSKDGSMIFAANEGERTDGDPMGGLSIIDLATGTSTLFDFSEFDTQVDALVAAGVRIFPGALPSTDFEPEYIAEAGGKLFITLQEANAVAIFDLSSMSWDKIVPLGTQDHSESALDASDRDDAINIQTYDDLVGLRMPDAIAATEIKGKTYFLTANEGDDRGDFDEGGDAARVGDILDGDVPGLSIDPSVDTTGLERLTVSIIDGDTDGDGDIDVLHSYGSRSFTIYDADGTLVFDSGSDFEDFIAQNRVPNAFNNDDFPSDDPDVIDENRSDNKGPEPEAIAVGSVDGKTLAFIGLERDGGIMIYDISKPASAKFVDYIDSSTFGHVSPEVIEFIPAEDSATGIAQIAVSYEISGTTALFDLEFGKKINGSVFSDTLDGSIGDDRIKGFFGNDVIDAKGGDDRVSGGFGKDKILGGTGNDRIDGGFGNDMIWGGADADRLLGGWGHDTIVGGSGDDKMTGGRGCDTFEFALGDGQDHITDFGRGDVLDLSATGLGFEDVTITMINRRTAEVAYGTEGDTITVKFAERHMDLDADDFLF